MIVKITYDDQRLDVFDTSAFTAGLPLGKANMLTNFEVRFDTMGEGGFGLPPTAIRHTANMRTKMAIFPSRGARRAGASSFPRPRSWSMLSSWWSMARRSSSGFSAT